jgi:hypothetical protein
MRRLALLLLSLSLLVGCEAINQFFAMWGGNNRVVDRALESPNESIRAEAAEVRQRANHYPADTGFGAE